MTAVVPRASDEISDAVPATGAWREGDPIGNRKFAHIGRLSLEAGGALPDVTLAYETWGSLNEDGSNAVLVLHALTGDSHVMGPAGPGHPTAGWWEDLVGPGKAIDTTRYFVVAPNVLGGCQGSTGPSSPGADGTPWGSRFPVTTVRDQVDAEFLLADALKIGRWALVLGGSMGGMRAVEWAAGAPDRVGRLAIIASTARSSADQIAWAAPQIAAIKASAGFNKGDYYDALPGEGPDDGLGVARRIAHITYRTGAELEDRFSNSPQGGEDPFDGDGRFAVESYLDYHATKLVRRFDANSYIALTQAMNTHNVGRARGGVEKALSKVTAHTLIVGVNTDRLYPVGQSEELARLIPGASLRTIESPFGHDGFLVESARIGAWISEILEK